MFSFTQIFGFWNPQGIFKVVLVVCEKRIDWIRWIPPKNGKKLYPNVAPFWAEIVPMKAARLRTSFLPLFRVIREILEGGGIVLIHSKGWTNPQARQPLGSVELPECWFEVTYVSRPGWSKSLGIPRTSPSKGNSYLLLDTDTVEQYRIIAK